MHMVEIIAGKKTPEATFHLTSPDLVLSLGLFLLCLVNSAAFRGAVGRFFTRLSRSFAPWIVEPIRWIVECPPLPRILHSRLLRLLFRFVIKPLVWTGVSWWLLP